MVRQVDPSGHLEQRASWDPKARYGAQADEAPHACVCAALGRSARQVTGASSLPIKEQGSENPLTSVPVSSLLPSPVSVGRLPQPLKPQVPHL